MLFISLKKVDKYEKILKKNKKNKKQSKILVFMPKIWLHLLAHSELVIQVFQSSLYIQEPEFH